jgi:uncharacterized protein YndB with AHSA1/START domain
MLTQTDTLTFEKPVKAGAGEVYRAFTIAQGLRAWLCDAAEVDPRKGGRFYLWWDDGNYTAGTITDLARDESLAFTWRGPTDNAPSQVRVTLTPHDGGTLIKVEHDGLSSDEDVAEMRKGWESALENLQSTSDTGMDLRIVRRPMFGLSEANPLDADIIARLGVPVKAGIWLGGLVEGMGAQKAGLQRDDVLVGLDGKEIANFVDFRNALDPHKAGERIEVVYYRGPERYAKEMELTARPIAEIPATLDALAEQARTGYATLDAELAALFEGASEAHAEYRPAEEEWNAKEILAHLIAGERDIQTWIAGTIEDAEVDDIFHSNGSERLKAIVSGYPTLTDIIEQLRREEAITTQMVATLPAKTLANKSFYFQLANYFSTVADHHHEHFGIIKSLLTAAKGH